MEVNLTTLSNYWFPLAGFVGMIAWLIRLESKVLYLEKDHESQKVRIGEKDAAMWEKMNSIQNTMSSIQQSIARIEGRMEHQSSV